MKKLLLLVLALLVLGVMLFWLWPEKGASTQEELLTSYTSALETKDLKTLQKITLDTTTDQQLQERLDKFGGTQADQLTITQEPNAVSSSFVTVKMKVDKNGTQVTDEFFLKAVDDRWYISYPH